jgi:ribosomal 50S subunit-recycling heat shock protein
MLRIDLFLKLSRVVKRRSQAKELCDEGVVRVNGKVVKSSKEIREGDIVEVDSVMRYLRFKVNRVPVRKNVSRKEARELITIEEDVRKDIKEIIDLI